MTNLVEILKNAPKGLELYSSVYGKVKLNCVKPNDPYPIAVEQQQCEFNIWVDEYGRINENGECVLFPSKEHKDWIGWQKTLFKEGHYITYIGKYTLITSKVPKCGFPKEDDYLGSRFATTEEIEQWYKYRATAKTKEEPTFTIDDFKPFDKVLVRGIFGWKIELFAIYHKGWDIPYECLGGSYDKCVPYNEETKRLLNTFIEYNGKYKTW